MAPSNLTPEIFPGEMGEIGEKSPEAPPLLAVHFPWHDEELPRMGEISPGSGVLGLVHFPWNGRFSSRPHPTVARRAPCRTPPKRVVEKGANV